MYQDQEMTEKDVIWANLYVTVSDEQLEKEKVKRSEKHREKTPEELKDFGERCDKRFAEAQKRARALEADYVGETIKSMRKARANAIARNRRGRRGATEPKDKGL